MKKFLLFLMVSLLVLTIYILNKDNKEYIFKIGDSLAMSINSKNIPSYDDYYKDYLKNDFEKYIVHASYNYRIGEAIRDIKSNIKVSDKNIQNILIKSDLVIIEIGIDELYNSLNVNNKYEYLDEMTSKMEELISIIRKYCKEKIVLVGYYNIGNLDNLKYVNYVNDKYKDISSKYNIMYIDLDFLNDKKYFSGNNYHINDIGYIELNNKILSTVYKNK